VGWRTEGRLRDDERERKESARESAGHDGERDGGGKES
jgi:hypothetical protein